MGTGGNPQFIRVALCISLEAEATNCQKCTKSNKRIGKLDSPSHPRFLNLWLVCHLCVELGQEQRQGQLIVEAMTPLIVPSAGLILLDDQSVEKIVQCWRCTMSKGTIVHGYAVLTREDSNPLVRRQSRKAHSITLRAFSMLGEREAHRVDQS